MKRLYIAPFPVNLFFSSDMFNGRPNTTNLTAERHVDGDMSIATPLRFQGIIDDGTSNRIPHLV